MHGACLGDAASACLIMELVPGGNLAERIYNPHKRRMSHLEILQVGAEMHPGDGVASLLGRGDAARVCARCVTHHQRFTASASCPAKI